MAQWLKQSTAITVKVGPFLDEDDGKTVEGSLTITQPDVRLSKNGGAFAQKDAAQTLSHDENGYYGLALNATDTATLGRLTVHIHESGALPVWHDFEVVTANVWDSFFGGGALVVSAGPIADAVFDEPREDHRNAGSVGEAIYNTNAVAANKMRSNNVLGETTVFADDGATELFVRKLEQGPTSDDMDLNPS